MTRDSIFVPRRGYHHGRLKDALVEAARDLVAERGMAGFTLSEAAKRVGVTAAAPYRHFADRSELMEELARRGFDLFALRLDAAYDDGRPVPWQAFQRMGDAYLAFAREEPGLYSAMFTSDGPLQTPGPRAAADRAFSVLQRGTEAILAAQGRIAEGGRTKALQIWSLAHGVASLAATSHLTAGGPGSEAQRTLYDGVAAILGIGASETGGTGRFLP